MDSKDNKTEKQCKALGASQVLLKPVTISAFNDAIQDCLSKSGASRRKHLRSRFTGMVNLNHMDKCTTLETRTLSKGGVFLRTNDPIAISEKVEGEFKDEGIPLCLMERLSTI
jgi:hypothetical protein